MPVSYLLFLSSTMKIFLTLRLVDHCLMLQGEWHSVRQEIEKVVATTDPDVEIGNGGNYKPEVFHGHCLQHGKYSRIFPSGRKIPESLWGGA